MNKDFERINYIIVDNLVRDSPLTRNLKYYLELFGKKHEFGNVSWLKMLRKKKAGGDTSLAAIVEFERAHEHHLALAHYTYYCRDGLARFNNNTKPSFSFYDYAKLMLDDLEPPKVIPPIMTMAFPSRMTPIPSSAIDHASCYKTNTGYVREFYLDEESYQCQRFALLLRQLLLASPTLASAYNK